MSPPPAHSPPPPDAKAFRCDVSRQNGTATVRVLGELDLAAVPAIASRLAELRRAGCRRLILDLRGLDFIDRSGLRCILKYDAEARQDGFSIGLIEGPRAVQRVFVLTETTDRLPFIDP
jgi:anti-sigma B factor antagonist